MRRRSYLTAITGNAALLSGCIATSGSGQSGDGSSNDRPDDAMRRVRITDFAGVPDDAPVSFDVAAEDPWITSSSTATLTVTTTNETDNVQRVKPAFIRVASSQYGPAGVVCYNHASRDFDVEAYTPPCFSDAPDESYVRTSTVDGEERVVFVRFGYGAEEIQPHESRDESVIVADDPTVEGCFPLGSYSIVDVVNYEMQLSFDIENV